MRRRLVTLLLLLFAGMVVTSGTAVAAAAAQDGEVLQGTLEGPDDAPVPGVEITVLRDGEPVGTATSGPDGSWEVALPGPGQYDVRLDTATLPAGLAPRGEDDATLRDVSVRPGQQRTVLFPLTAAGANGGEPGAGTGPAPPGAGGTAGPGIGSRVPQLVVSGVKYGTIIAITAIGLSLVFGTTGLINFAHGELVTIGAMTAFFLNAAASGPGMPLVAAAAVAVGVGALVGGALERGLWRPLRNRGTGRINLFIISIGLALFLRHIILVFFGSRPQPYADYAVQQALRFGPIAITPRDLVITLLALAVLLAVGLMLQRSRIGKAMRAVADDRDLAAASGVDVSRVILQVWMLGGGLAALGGVLFGLSEIVTWDMGFRLLLLMFAAVILGGLGSAFGAMAGGLLVGLVAQLSTLYFPVELQNAWALGVLILVLLVRPRGIFGRAERVG